MKRPFAFACLFFVLLAGVSIFAAAVNYTRNAGRLRALTYEFNYASDGSVASVDAKAVFVGYWANTADATDTPDDKDTRQVVPYNLIVSPTTTITAAGATVTRLQLAALNKKDAESR